MANKELHDLRHKYKAAFTTYMRSVQALSEASQNGELPAAAVIDSERIGFNELRAAREALLRAMKEHNASKR